MVGIWLTALSSLDVLLHAQMLLESMDGASLVKSSFNEIMSSLRNSARPLTLQFRATKEHVVLQHMVQAFLLADTDGSGALDREELAGVLKNLYRSGATAPRFPR